MPHRPVKTALLLAVMTLATGAVPLANATSPDAPTSLLASPGEGRIVLTWSDPTTGAPDVYRVFHATTGGDVLLAQLPGTAHRHVDGGLADGQTRTYRVEAVKAGVPASTDPVTQTTFAPATTSSSFAAGPEGFTLERSGGATVAWSSSNGAILVTQPSGASASDTILSRPLPATWTSEDTDFHVSAVVTRVQGGHDADFWALALAPAGTGDLASRPGTIGVRVEENTQTGGDGGHGVHFMFVGTDGTRPVDVEHELCFGCALRTTYRVSLAYDSTNRTLTWTVMSDEGAFAQQQSILGARAGDFFNVTSLAIASDTPPASGTAQHTVDDVVVTWKRAESRPTSPTNLTVTRTGAGAALLAWAAPMRAGTEPVAAYDILRDGVSIASVSSATFSETGIPRWSWTQYQVRARSELGAGWPAFGTLAPEAGERAGAETFDTTPPEWIEWRDPWPSDSRVRVFESRGELALSYDTVGSARYGVPLDGATWRPATGSFSVQATYRDEGSGRATGACPLALLPASTNACTGPGIVAEFRAENRTAASPPSMHLRFVDAAGATKLDVRHALAQTGTWRVNATYDHTTSELTMRLRNATGVLLAQGSVIVAADAFALGFSGVTAGIGSHGLSPQEGVGFVEDFEYAFAAPQPVGVPAPPTSVVAEPLNADGRALVTWQPPAGGPVVGSYRVYRAGGDGRFVLAGSTTSTSFEDDALTRRSSYLYRVSALGAAGEGLAGGRAWVRTYDVPGVVRGLGVATTGEGGQLRVTWGQPDADEFRDTVTSYEVRRDDALIATLAPETRTWLDTGLAEGSFHVYKVRAVNGVGPGPDASKQAFAPSRPSAPLLLRDTQGPDVGTVNVTWAPPFTTGGLPLLAYRVYRDGALVSEQAQPWLVETGLAEGATLAYRVTAVNAVGEGPAATRVVEVASRAGAPATLTGAPGPALGGVALAWGAAQDGGLPITSYRVYRTVNGTTTLAGTVTNLANLTFRDAGLPDATLVMHEVAAVTALGEGERASVTTLTWTRLAPEPVRDLTASRSGFGTNRVAWELPLANAGPPIQEIRVYRIGGLQGETLAATLTPTARSFLDLPTQWARQPAPDYAYRVVAVNLVGASGSEWTGPVSPLL